MTSLLGKRIISPYYMDFLYWCSNTGLCQAFNQYEEYIPMNTVSREIVIKGNHPIPGEPRHVYGGIYTLSSLGMLGTGISRGYLVDACRKNHILIVAIEKIDPRLYPITDESIEAIQHSRILGCITANIRNDRCIEIDTISSRSHYAGVGTNLMFKLLDAAKESMNVCILNSLVSSMGFYMRLGFTYLGTDQEETPVFAVDLTKMDIQPPRLYLKRQSTNVPVTIDERSLDEVEHELLGKHQEIVTRNIPIEDYVKDIGRLDTGSHWTFLDRGIKIKHGFLIPDTVKVQKIKNTQPFMSKVKTYTNHGSRNHTKYTLKVKTYLNKPLRSSRSRSKRATNLRATNLV